LTHRRVNSFYIRGTRGWPARAQMATARSDSQERPVDHYAAGIALAASWDVDLAQRVGEMLGRDARARGVHFLLAPAVNIYRAPISAQLRVLR